MEDLEPIKAGRVANDGTGDDLRTANITTNTNMRIAQAAVRDAQAAAKAALDLAESASTGFLDREAAVDIPASTAVVGINDLIRPADPSNLAHRGLVLGIVRDPIPAGARAAVRATGTLTGVSGAFGQRQRIFIGAGGSLTATVPRSGWRQAVGTASSSSSIVVSLGFAVATRDVPPLLVKPGEDAITEVVLAALTPALFGRALKAFGSTLPWLVEGGTIPAAAGIFRRGSPEFYDIVVIEAQS